MIRLARTWTLALICFATVLLSSAAYAQQSEQQPLDLVGTYTHGGGFASSSITIEPDGRFHTRSSDCTQEYYDGGTYTFKAGVISFTTVKRTVKSHGESDDAAKDLLDPKVYKEMYHQELTAEAKEELIPLKWDDRLYLVPKENLIEFCNAINLGLEPRNSLGTGWYLGSSYLRNGDEKKPAKGLPSLSNELIDLLLKKPVEAEVISIEREGETEVAIINKGSEAGLKPGMRLVLTRPRFWDGPNLWSGLVVISATYHLARLKVLEEVKLGDKVSSKYVPREYLRTE